jgi:hypothetical protein
MLDFSHLPDKNSEFFVGAVGNAETFRWVKPRGKSMCQIILVGNGGNGGTAIASDTVGAGGGGGSSGSTTITTMPLHLLPDALYITLGWSQANGVLSSQVAVNESVLVPQAVVCAAANGRAGGNAVTAGGTAGPTSTSPTAAGMPIGWLFSKIAATHAGSAGGTNAAGTSLSLPTTGAIVTGGSGGGGWPLSAGAGLAGGAFNVTAGADFPPQPGGIGAATATTPGGHGNHGFKISGKLFFYGGTGGGGTYNAATGAGLAQGNGGNGAPGCGGGGAGGGRAGSTLGLIGNGGPAFCIITCW